MGRDRVNAGRGKEGKWKVMGKVRDGEGGAGKGREVGIMMRRRILG